MRIMEMAPGLVRPISGISIIDRAAGGPSLPMRPTDKHPMEE